MSIRPEVVNAAARAIVLKLGMEWDEAEEVDRYEASGVALTALNACVPLLLNDLADRIEADATAYQRAADLAARRHSVRYTLPERLQGLAVAAGIVRAAAEGWAS